MKLHSKVALIVFIGLCMFLICSMGMQLGRNVSLGTGNRAYPPPIGNREKAVSRQVIIVICLFATSYGLLSR